MASGEGRCRVRGQPGPWGTLRIYSGQRCFSARQEDSAATMGPDDGERDEKIPHASRFTKLDAASNELIHRRPVREREHGSGLLRSPADCLPKSAAAKVAGRRRMPCRDGHEAKERFPRFRVRSASAGRRTAHGMCLLLWRAAHRMCLHSWHALNSVQTRQARMRVSSIKLFLAARPRAGGVKKQTVGNEQEKSVAAFGNTRR